MGNHDSIKTDDLRTVTSLRELARLFLNLGAISFGAPAGRRVMKYHWQVLFTQLPAIELSARFRAPML